MSDFSIELNSFNVIISLVSVIFGVAVFILGVYILNKVPASWLCDYDEEPSQEMLTQTRFKGAALYIIGGLLSAFTFELIYIGFGFDIYSLLLMLITCVLILIILSDAKYCIIPDQFVVMAGILSLIFAYYDFFGRQYFIKSWWSPIVSGAGVGLLIIAVNFITMIIAKKEGMGFGDVKLFTALGIATGFPNIVIALFISVITAFLMIVVTVIVNAVRKKETDNYIPFGPSICIGVFVTIVLNQPIIYLVELYLSLFVR